jgi:tRNA threonylcarbamoyladenosine biosynthesis protein TsaE
MEPMSKQIAWETTTLTPEDTEAIAERLGNVLRGGEVLELISDLGGGKTTFVRGLARGAGSTDTVGSPTFTISRVYKTNQKTIRHYDFYRLSEPGLMAAELSESVGDPEDIVVVEWGDVVQDVLPSARVQVRFEQTEEGRTIRLEAPESLAYVIEAAKAV